MKKKLVWVSGLTLVFACVGVGTSYWNKRQVEIEQAKLEERKKASVEKVRNLVRASLKDPGSAIFQDVVYNEETQAGCGFVNAKNSFGGYVGRKMFFVSRNGQVEFEQKTPEGTMTVEKLGALANAIGFNNKVQADCLGQAKELRSSKSP
ncbi:MAG TPA: hypothetical protein VIM12_04275 [Noviherbaspirillum sp.]|jgi:hypothetical protein|uniref:hypothetical protein n=1 Tax=Noviherbaspirillum sp. TaxID=1926288 RepID=UPI002F92F414